MAGLRGLSSLPRNITLIMQRLGAIGHLLDGAGKRLSAAIAPVAQMLAAVAVPRVPSLPTWSGQWLAVRSRTRMIVGSDA